jgi:hypothetical protein
MLVIGESQFHIDPGPGALVAAAKNQINLRANTAVLVSNNDLLNCNDVNAVIDAMTHSGEDRTGVLVSNNTIVNGAEGINPYLTNLHKSFLEKIIVLNKGQKLGIEDVEIHALPAANNDPYGTGFKFLAPDFTLVYSSDTSYSKDLINEYKGADILILKVAEPGSEKSENKLNSEDAAKIINAVSPKLAIITGFGMNMLKADPLIEGREIQKQTGVQVIAAKDNMGIVPSSYSAKSSQKRLSVLRNIQTGEVKIEEKSYVPLEQEETANEEEQESAEQTEEANEQAEDASEQTENPEPKEERQEHL